MTEVHVEAVRRRNEVLFDVDMRVADVVVHQVAGSQRRSKKGAERIRNRVGNKRIPFFLSHSHEHIDEAIFVKVKAYEIVAYRNVKIDSAIVSPKKYST